MSTTDPNKRPIFYTSLSRAEFIREFFPVSPYVGYLGMRLIDMQPDTATLLLPFNTSLITIGTIIHGGAIASLIDTATMVAAWSDSSIPDNPRGTTVALTVNYLAPAESEDLQAKARVLRRGRSLVYVDVEAHTTSGVMIAKGLVTYKLG